MEKSDLVFITNQKGRPALLHNGHKYNLGNYNKSGSSMWRCVNRPECNASLSLNSDKDTVIRKPSQHVCKSHHDQNKRDLLVDSCKKDVCSTMAPVKKIFEKHVAKFTETEKDKQLIMCSYEEKKNSLYRARHKFLEQQNTEFKYIKDVHVPNILTENFLLVEDGEEEKILIFCSSTARKYLKNFGDKNQQYFGDGTFKRVPKPFYQIYSIHIDIGTGSKSTNVVPVIFALLPNKTQDTYRRFFTLLRNKLDLQIQNYKCDYELAQINACKEIFPDCKLSGCYYHYNHAIWKKAKNIKVDDTRDGRNIVRMCANLPLLPKENIQSCWLSIFSMAPMTEKMKSFTDYMEKQWLKLDASILSCAEDRHRSNNAIEGWHRRLNVRMPHKPTMVRFLFKLKKEAKYQDTRLKNSLFSGASRRKNEILFDLHYGKQLQELREGAITPVAFLKNINTLKKRVYNYVQMNNNNPGL